MEYQNIQLRYRVQEVARPLSQVINSQYKKKKRNYRIAFKNRLIYFIFKYSKI